MESQIFGPEAILLCAVGKYRGFVLFVTAITFLDQNLSFRKIEGRFSKDKDQSLPFKDVGSVFMIWLVLLRSRF